MVQGSWSTFAFLRSKDLSELEAPRAERPFGTGWIAGTLGLAAAVTGLALVLALKFPDLFATPELKRITFAPWFRFVILFLLIAGFALAALSMVLRSRKTLGVTALAVTLLATLIGGLRPTSGTADTEGHRGFFPWPRLLHRQSGVPRVRTH